MDSFKEYVLQESGAYLNAAWSGLANTPGGVGGDTPSFPEPTLEIPTKSITSRIRSLFYTKNPITMTMEDGTVWKVSKGQWDYLVSIGQEPKEGRTVQMEIYLDGTIKSIFMS